MKEQKQERSNSRVIDDALLMDFADSGLQRAIYASLQAQFEYARVVASGGGASRSVTRQPQPQVARSSAAPRYVPPANCRRGDLAPTAPSSVFHGKRSTLAREGIMPLPSRGGGGRRATGESPAHNKRPINQQVGGDGPVTSGNQAQPDWVSEYEEDADPNNRPLPRPTDLLVGWKEILSGGRVQRQARDGSHLLLVTEEPYSSMVNSFMRSDVVAIRGEGPLFSSSGLDDRGKLPVDAVASVSAHVQNLGSSRGRYVCCVLGIVLAPGEEAASLGFTGVSIHFDANGSVYVSLDQWRVNPSTDGVDKVSVLQAAVPIRVLRDRVHVHLRVRSSWPHHLLDVLVHHEPLFTGVALPSCSPPCDGQTAVDSADVPLERVRPLFCASGGRISLKSIVLGDAPQPPANASSSPSSDQPRPVTKSQPVRKTTASPAPAPRISSHRQVSESSRPIKGVPPPPAPVVVNGVDAELVQRIEDEILDRSPHVSWDDIAGMGDAKRLLNEAVVLPLIVPELFTGVLQPWKGVLLFGPPGTGKTMLAKAVAASAKTTFFNMSASTLIQKHFGESEKMVRALFEVARARSPSTIFFDEVDALMSSRGSSSEHEAMRRVKTELLRQMDGLHGNGADTCRVMVLATTNRPWDLDEAMRRRLEKRIYVPLPDLGGRLDILHTSTKGMLVTPSLRLEPVARRTEGFSGADLHLLCRNAGMMPMRRLVEGKSPEQLAAMKARGEIVMGHVTEDDFMLALDKMAPSVGRSSLAEFDTWASEFAST